MDKSCSSSGEPMVEISDEAPNDKITVVKNPTDESHTAINDLEKLSCTKFTTEEFTNLITPEVLSCIKFLIGNEGAAIIHIFCHTYGYLKRCQFDFYRKKHQEESYEKDRQIMFLKQQNQAKAEELKLFTQVNEQQVQKLHGVYQKQLKDKDESHQEQLKDKDLFHQKQLKDKDQSLQEQLRDKDQSHQEQLKDKDQSYQEQLKTKDLFHQEQLKDKDLFHQEQLKDKDLSHQEQLKNKDMFYQELIKDKDHFYQLIIQHRFHLLEQNDEQFKDQFHLHQRRSNIRQTAPHCTFHPAPCPSPYPNMQTNGTFAFLANHEKKFYNANHPRPSRSENPVAENEGCTSMGVPKTVLNHPVSDSL